MGIAVASMEGEKGELKAVFVPKVFRGRGVARVLVEERVRYLQEQGAQKIHVDATSPGALRIATELKEKYPELIEYTDHGDHFR